MFEVSNQESKIMQNLFVYFLTKLSFREFCREKV